MSLSSVWTIDTYAAESVPNFAVELYEGVLPYIVDFLCSRHPYRKGKVCPFVPMALKQERIFFTAFEKGHSSKNFKSDAKSFLISCCDYYLETKTNHQSFGALIILFPKNYPIAKLLEIHLDAKEFCVKKSLMLGALWRDNQAKSLHCDDFFPLRTPTPTLVLRDLTLPDLLFLSPRHYGIRKRILFLTSFIDRFYCNKGDQIQRSEVIEAIKLRKKYRFRLGLIYIICGLIFTGLIIFVGA